MPNAKQDWGITYTNHFLWTMPQSRKSRQTDRQTDRQVVYPNHRQPLKPVVYKQLYKSFVCNRAKNPKKPFSLNRWMHYIPANCTYIFKAIFSESHGLLPLTSGTLLNICWRSTGDVMWLTKWLKLFYHMQDLYCYFVLVAKTGNIVYRYMRV